MSSGFFEGALETVAACGVAGAFIDFWIGRTGQQRLRRWLEEWWIRLSYVRWGNFGREEALFAIQILDRLFGRRLFSLRRLYASLAAAGVSIAVAAIATRSLTVMADASGDVIEQAGIHFIIDTMMFSVSISITRAAASKVVSLIGDNEVLNLIWFILLLLFSYVMICYWVIVVSYANSVVVAAILTSEYGDSLRVGDVYNLAIYNIVVRPFNPIALFNYYRERLSGINENSLFQTDRLSRIALSSVLILELLPNLGRLLVALIFVGSFFLQPLRHPITTLWARIVESGKPVFTLVFGGIAAIATIMDQIVKVL